MNTNAIRAIHSLTATAGAGLLVALLPVSATASQDRGKAVISVVSVRPETCPWSGSARSTCGATNLIGAGVPAPFWVPQHP